MKSLNEILEQKQASKEWSRDIADRVLLTRRAKNRKAGFVALSLAVSFVVIGGAVSLHQKARQDSFKYVFDSALEEVLPQYDSSIIASAGINQKTIGSR